MRKSMVDDEEEMRVIVRKIQKPKWPERLRDWPAMAYAMDESESLWVYENCPSRASNRWLPCGDCYQLPKTFIREFYPNGVPDWKDSLVKREDCE